MRWIILLAIVVVVVVIVVVAWTIAQPGCNPAVDLCDPSVT